MVQDSPRDDRPLAAIDWEAARSLYGPLAEDILTDLMPTFLDEAERRVELLAGAAEAGTTTDALGHAHSLKGAASAVAATTLATMGDRLETDLRHGEPVDLRVVAGAIAAEVLRVRAAWADHLGTPTADS